MRFFVQLLVGLLWLAPTFVIADGAPVEPDRPPAVLTGSTTALGEWRTNNRNGSPDDDNFGDALLRSNLTLDGGDTRMFLRFDAEGFVGNPRGVPRHNDFRLERFGLDLERSDLLAIPGDRLHLQLGDLYANFGRGLALSLRRIDELGLDVALRGGRLDLDLGDDRVVATLLAGVANPVNIESQGLRHVDDPGDTLAAGRVETRISDGVSAGAHVVMAQEPSAADLAGRRRTTNIGLTADATIGDASFGFEYDAQQRYLPSEATAGQAFYGTSTIPLGRVVILFEGKHYARFQPLTGSRLSSGEGRFLYSLPPTAERIDQELIDNTDISGGRTRVDLAMGPGGLSNLHGSLGIFGNRDLGQWFMHGFAGADLRRASGLAVLVSGGYRREWFWDTGALARAIGHGEIDLIIPISLRWSMHAITRDQIHAEGDSATRYVYHRGSGSVELDRANRLTVGGGVDWDTQNQNPEVARRFGYGLIRYRHSDSVVVGLLAGTQRGGIRCIAGACRVFPPFSGVRLDLTLRH